MGVVVASRDSLLTSSSGYTNYRGILNLVIILLVLSNARAALENVIKYGILVDPLSWFSFVWDRPKHVPALLVALGLQAHLLLALAVERYMARAGPRLAARLLLVANLAACLAGPPMLVYAHQSHPISASAALMLVSIVFLKLVSYHMMNFWCRDVRLPERQWARTTRAFMRSYVPPALEFSAPAEPTASQDGQKAPSGTAAANCPTPSHSANPPSQPRRLTSASASPNAATHAQHPHQDHRQPPKGGQNSPALEALARYPRNLTLNDLLAFVAFPTLCYELEFARTARIRKRFLLKRLVELVILSQLDIALVQQWIVPTVSNSMLPLRQMQPSHMLERLLKLAIPNHVIWLLWFYLFFHSFLNICAELSRFADRQFYRDWWNSESVYYFWSNWNIPVHKWCARHLYIPLMALGLTKCQASTAVFFVSAFFHEYLVSVPLKMFRMWAFTGMLVQLPWARFVSRYFNHQFANVAVWVSLIIGQPLCILMYYHDYYVIHNAPAYALPAR